MESALIFNLYRSVSLRLSVSVPVSVCLYICLSLSEIRSSTISFNPTIKFTVIFHEQAALPGHPYQRKAVSCRRTSIASAQILPAYLHTVPVTAAASWIHSMQTILEAATPPRWHWCLQCLLGGNAESVYALRPKNIQETWTRVRNIPRSDSLQYKPKHSIIKTLLTGTLQPPFQVTAPQLVRSLSAVSLVQWIGNLHSTHPHHSILRVRKYKSLRTLLVPSSLLTDAGALCFTCNKRCIWSAAIIS